jgi:hypothetical protein
MSYRDVREWIQKVDEMSELKVVEGADWDLEIGRFQFWPPSTKRTRRHCCSTASKVIRIEFSKEERLKVKDSKLAYFNLPHKTLKRKAQVLGTRAPRPSDDVQPGCL